MIATAIFQVRSILPLHRIDFSSFIDRVYSVVLVLHWFDLRSIAFAYTLEACYLSFSFFVSLFCSDSPTSDRNSSFQCSLFQLPTLSQIPLPLDSSGVLHFVAVLLGLGSLL